jgi:copper(I)-binding protein
MRRRLWQALFTITAFFVLAIVPALPAWAQAPGVSVEKAFARATIALSPNGAVYLTVRNPTDEPDKLVGAFTLIAKRAELHTHLHEGGVMKMRPIEAVTVPPGGSASLKPGADHIMLTGLSQPLKEGDRFELVLTFEKAGELPVMVTVGAVGATEAAHGAHKHKN